MLNDLQSLLNEINIIVVQAGELVLAHKRQYADFDVNYKADGTPVTVIDKLTSEFIESALQKLTPHVGVVSEEGSDTPSVYPSGDFWLVDPIDGTKGFINGLKDYTVNIALVREGSVVLGNLYAPETKTLYYASVEQGAFMTEASSSAVRVHTKHEVPWRCVIGRYHNPARLRKIMGQHIQEDIFQVNSSLKLAMVGSGQADLYPRLGPTSGWDTAAGQVIVEQAGGVLVDFSGKKLQYVAGDSVLNPEFFACSDPAMVPDVLKIHNNLRSSS